MEKSCHSVNRQRKVENSWNILYHKAWKRSHSVIQEHLVEKSNHSVNIQDHKVGETWHSVIHEQKEEKS